MNAAIQDAYDHPVIPRGRAENAVGSLTLVKAAEEANIIEIHRTATGREYITPRHYAELVRFAAARLRERK